MYSLISAIGRIKGVNNPWKSVDISNTTMRELFSTYRDVYVTLSNPLYPNNRVLKLSDIRTQHQSSQLSFTQWLTFIGNTTLPTTGGEVRISSEVVRYADAHRSEYRVQTLGNNFTVNPNIPDSQRDHLALTRPQTNYSNLQKYCLAVVNGLIHRIDYNAQMAVIYNGNKFSRNCKRREVGLLSFKLIGELEIVGINANMIHRRHENTPLSEKLYIELDEEYDGMPMLVFGGYLHTPHPELFYNVSEKTYCLETGRISLLARLMESREHAGSPFPPLTPGLANAEMVAVDELLSDAKIKEVATQLETFFVFVKAEHLNVSQELLPRTKIPGNYKVTSSKFNNLPIVGGYGMLSNYWSIADGEEHSIRISDWYRVNYTFLTTNGRTCLAVDNVGYSSNSKIIKDLAFLSIMSEKIEIIPV